MSRAKELIFTGSRVKAEDALSLGLVNYVSPDFEQAVAKAVELAGVISEKGPIAIRAAKKAVHYGIDLPLDQGLALEDECYKMVINTEDRLEGLKAFAEKRPPVYKGK